LRVADPAVVDVGLVFEVGVLVDVGVVLVDEAF
jgi:hypothetical protein